MIIAYDVFLDDVEIDTIFYGSTEPADDVRRSLINHDGHNPAIVVKRRATDKNGLSYYDDIAPEEP